MRSPALIGVELASLGESEAVDSDLGWGSARPGARSERKRRDGSERKRRFTEQTEKHKARGVSCLIC